MNAPTVSVPGARWLKYVLPLAVFAAIGATLLYGLDHDPREIPSPLVGKPAPEFSLPRLHHPEARLGTQDLLGKVSLLNVWASWCVACRAEHPVLLRIARELAVPIYGLNYKDERADAVQWLGSLGDPYAASAYDHEGKVGLDLGVYGVPETFLIGPSGKIVYKQIGPIDPAVWQKKILPKIRAIERRAG